MLKNKLYVYGGEDWTIPAHINYGRTLLNRIWEFRDRIAIINAETADCLSFGDVAKTAISIALSLARLGVKKGDVVSICSEKRLEFIPTIIGANCAGATFAPADITCGRATLLHRINIAKPKVMFVSPEAWKLHSETLKTVPGLDHLIVYGDTPQEGAVLYKDFLTEKADFDDFMPVEVNVDDLAIILYSSGTTGLPKGIPHTQLSYMYFLHQLVDPEFHTNKRMLSTREWYYSYGLVYTMNYLLVGGTVVYCPHNEEKYFLEAIQKYRIAAIQLAPATVAEFVKSTILDEYDVSSVERIISASTPLDDSLTQAAKKRFSGLKDIFQIYGMSEAGCPCVSETSPKGAKPGSVGTPTRGYVLKVVDLETRQPLGPNNRGEICVKSRGFMRGYIGVDVTEDYLDDEGFFKTGDIGYYDEDGYFFIVDRIKELIKFNSFQVAPAELEAVLQAHPGVREAGVVGAPHPQYGQAPTAFVARVPGADVTEEQLVAYVDGEVSYRMRLAGGVRFVDALPRGAGAKLDRKKLKLML